MSKEVTMLRWGSFGDVIQCSTLATQLHARGWKVRFATIPVICEILKGHPHIHELVPIRIGDTCGDVILDRTYEDHPDRKTRHHVELYREKVNAWLGERGEEWLPDEEIEPILIPDPAIKGWMHRIMSGFKRPWTMVAPRSNGYAVRTVNYEVWKNTAVRLPGTVFWTGTDKSPDPKRLIDLRMRSFTGLIAAIANCDLLLTVESGPLHIGRALGKRIVLMEQSTLASLRVTSLTDCEVVKPDNLNCLGCCEEQCPKNPKLPPCQIIDHIKISEAAKRMLAKPKP